MQSDSVFFCKFACFKAKCWQIALKYDKIQNQINYKY